MHRLSFPACQEVRCTSSHRRAEAGGIADEGDAAVIGNVEPFVRIRCPRIGQFHALDERAASRLDASPQTKRSVDVHPCACLTRNGAYVLERVTGTRIDVPGLQTQKR